MQWKVGQSLEWQWGEKFKFKANYKVNHVKLTEKTKWRKKHLCAAHCLEILQLPHSLYILTLKKLFKILKHVQTIPITLYIYVDSQKF